MKQNLIAAAAALCFSAMAGPITWNPITSSQPTYIIQQQPQINPVDFSAAINALRDYEMRRSVPTSQAAVPTPPRVYVPAAPTFEPRKERIGNIMHIRQSDGAEFTCDLDDYCPPGWR